MLDAIPVPIELGVPLPSNYKHADLKQRVDAACATAQFLIEHGAEYPQPTKQDKEEAARLATAHALDEAKASRENDNKVLTREPPQVIMYAKAILDEYGHKVADSSAQIRHTVTTKLIEMTENADPKVRLKALELLGKISDVGLFSEKTEITVTHQTSDELKEKLRTKLEKLINPPTEKTDPELAQMEQKFTTEVDEAGLDFSDVPLDGEYEEVHDDG